MACVKHTRRNTKYVRGEISSYQQLQLLQKYSPSSKIILNASKMAPTLVRNLEVLRSLLTEEPVKKQILRNAKRAAVAAGPGAAQHLLRRSLKVNDAQKVTLGIIAVYIVVIALLWNIPVLRWSLWPFKVSYYPALKMHLETTADFRKRCSS